MQQQLVDLARQQYGVVTRDQARAARLSDDQVDDRVARGELIRPQPGVLQSSWTPSTLMLRCHAALLSIGDDAALAGLCAAAVWDLPYVPTATTPEVAVSAHRHPARRNDVVLRRRTDLVMSRSVTRRGVRVLSLEDTVCDVVHRLSEGDAEAVVTALLRFERRTTEGRLLSVCTHGRPGAAALRRAVATCSDEHQSRGERLCRRLLRRAGLRPAPQLVLDEPGGRIVARFDLALQDLRIAFEVKGWSAHGKYGAFQDDVRREIRIILGQRWQVVSVTHRYLQDHGDEFVSLASGLLPAPVSAAARRP